MVNIRRFHPGEYLKDSLEAMEMTAKEFSMRTGISERTLSAIITGNGNITFDIAYKLSVYFDNSINYWINLQTQYDMYLMEAEKQKERAEEWSYAKLIKKYLLSLKCIKEDDDKDTIIRKCRNLAGVNSLLLLNKKDSFVCLKEQHTEKENDCFYQNFWIALALNEARKRNGVPYNKKLLLDSLDEMRGMTIRDPVDFYPRLQVLLNECGISFVLLPYLSKSNIYGATKWFSKENVMLAVSNRSERADLFWFTLFHEIAHVLMEHRREALINIKGSEDDEADRMAADMLINNEEWNKFVDYDVFNVDTIEKFAKRVGVHPCIVLGRLHKEKADEVPYGTFDKHFACSYEISIN